MAGLLAFAMLAGCSGKPSQQQSSTTPHNVTLTTQQQSSIHTYTVASTQYHTTITTTGVVDFDHDHATDILAPFSGAVTKVFVTQGQHVVKGQALAEVASPDFASAAGAYRQTVLAAKAADAVATNDRDLFAHQAISQRENAQAQADAATADSNRDAALQTLVALHMDPRTIAAIRDGKPVAGGQGVILAPIAGTLVTKSIAPGQTLAAGTTPCFTIANTATMWVMANVFGDDAAHVRDGDAATADANRDAALQTLVALHMDPRTIAAIRDGKPVAGGQGVILAPIAGTLVTKSIAPGQTLAAGTTPCFTIANTATMWVMANVFGDDAAHVRDGDAATVVTGDGGKPIEGTVTNVGAVVDPDTRSVAARVRVDNADGALRKQMYVTVHIKSHEAHEGLLVPVSAVLRDDENLPFVYAVDSDGSYARRSISLGARVGDRYVAPEGLRPGDKVVVDGSIFLQFIQSQ